MTILLLFIYKIVHHPSYIFLFRIINPESFYLTFEGYFTIRHILFFYFLVITFYIFICFTPNSIIYLFWFPSSILSPR